MKKLTTFLLTLLVSLSALAYDIRLEGSVGGKYPIVVWLQVADGSTVLSGKYAYTSTLRKNKNASPDNFLYVKTPRDDFNEFTVLDSKGNYVETWYDVSYSAYRDRYSISGWLRTAKGKMYRFDVSCTYKEISPRSRDFFRWLAGN